ncbi:hypothetical protein D3C73_509980 [compost metagenome]
MALILVTFLPTASFVNAAAFEFSATTQTNFDKLTAAADSATAARLKQQYTDLLALQLKDQSLDGELTKIKKSNDAADLLTRQRLKEIDTINLNKLEQEVKAIREKYASLFQAYESLNKQLSVARSLKNKWLTTLLSTQAESMKTAVQLARLHIRSKDDALQAAKVAKSKTVKQVRLTLADIEPLETQIKAAKSTISTINKQFNTEGAIVKQAIKSKDAGRTLDGLTRMLSYLRQVTEQKQKTVGYHQKITAIIAKADKQF